MTKEVLEEVKNILEGRSGMIYLTMVNHIFSLTMQGTEDVHFKMIMYIISLIAEKEGISYKEYVETLLQVCEI